MAPARRGVARVVTTVLVTGALLGSCTGGGSSEGSTGSRPDVGSAAPLTTTPGTVAPVTTTVPTLALDRGHGVGVSETTFVDPSRRTPAVGSFSGSSDRTFPVTVWYPAGGDPDAPPQRDAPPDRADGPYPLVVFAHGFAVTPAFYVELLRRWAAAGYVVAAPTYPILSGVPAGPSHDGYEETFADTQFVITQIQRAAAEGAAPFAGLLAPGRIAVAGHSDGEVIAFGLGFLRCCRDGRVSSVIAMAGDLSNIANPLQPHNGVPVLHILEDHDEFDPYAPSIEWDRENLTAPKWSMTLLNGTHAPPYTRPSDPYFPIVVDATVAFLDATVKGHPERLDRLYALPNEQPGRVALED
jgi:fermentation-respiration switch protein FrsA (DUF1100 family)